MGLELKAMRLRTCVAVLLCCLALPLLGQNSQPAAGESQGGSPQSSEAGDASTPQPVSGASNSSSGGQQEDSSQSGQDKKPSGIKKVLRRGAPNCAHVGAGGDHCWSESEREKEAEQKQAEQASQQQPVPPSQPAPRSSDEDCADCSSSRSSHVDLTPPPGDAATHPGADLPSDVQELHPWDPHRADKDVEVGDFYFKQKNYKAAIARYRDALTWMSNHAAATYKLGLALEKTGDTTEARQQYQQYLKLLPDGPYAKAARKALERLPSTATQNRATPPPAQKSR